MKSKNIPMRTCVGCRQVKPKGELIRVVSGENGLAADPAGKKNGRGVYICPDRRCMEAAVKNNGFKRSLKKNIDISELDKLLEELKEYEEQN